MKKEPHVKMDRDGPTDAGSGNTITVGLGLISGTVASDLVRVFFKFYDNFQEQSGGRVWIIF